MASAVFGIKADFPRSTVTESLAGWPLVLAGAALMLVGVLGMPRRFLPAPLVYLGRISYGLYLTHIFFFWLVYDKFKPELTRACDAVGLGPGATRSARCSPSPGRCSWLRCCIARSKRLSCG